MILPGLYLLLLGGGLALVLSRWFDPVPWRIWAVFASLLVALFLPVLFGGDVLLPLDNLRAAVPFRDLPPAPVPSHGLQADLVHQIAPWSLAVRRELADGRWPLWNALAGAGMPLMGDPQAQAFQPLLLAAGPLPFFQAVGVTAALRVLVALVFFFLLLRRQGLGEPAALFGSLAYGLGGFLMLWLGWPMANGAALLPLGLYAVVRVNESGMQRDAVLLCLATFALLLGGHPETILYSLGALGAVLLTRRKRLLTVLAAMALGGLLATPVLLPVADYLPKTDRAAVVGFVLAPRPVSELFTELARPKVLERWRQRVDHRLVPLVAPRAFGDHGFYWGGDNVIEDASGFAGSLTLLAAALALLPGRRFPGERAMVGLLGASLLLLAQPPGLDRLLFRLPLVGATAIHQQHRILLVVVLAVSYLAACEIERRTRGERRCWPLVAGVLLLAALVAWGYLAHPHPDAPEAFRGLAARWMSAQLLALAAGGSLLWLAGRPRRWNWVAWALCAVVGGELLFFHRPAHPPAPARLAYPATPQTAFLQSHLGGLGGFRMTGLGGGVLPPNFGSVYGLNDVRIDNPSFPFAYGHATFRLRRPSAHVMWHRPGHPVYDLLGVRYVVTRPGARLPFRLVLEHPDGWIFERPHALPRLFLPERARAHRGGPWADWLEGNRDFTLRSVVQASTELRRTWRARRPERSRVTLALLSSTHVRASTELAERRLLAGSLYQDGHWKLLADGARRPTVLANGPFVAAWLGAGSQRIDLLYRPLPFVAGCLLAALGLCAALLWWIPLPRYPR